MATSIKSILGEAIRTPCKNGKLTLVIVLFSLIPQLLFYFIISFRLSSNFSKILEDASSLKLLLSMGFDINSPEARAVVGNGLMKDMKDLAVFLIIAIAVAAILSIFEWIIVAHSVYMTRLGEQVAPKDLLCKVRTTWIGTLLTTMLASLLCMVYLGALVCTVALLVLIFSDSPVLTGLSIAVVSMLWIAMLPYVYLTSQVATVISIVEDGCSGMAALDKSLKNLRGRKMQGSLLILTLVGMFILYRCLSAVVTIMAMEADVFRFLWGVVDFVLMQMLFFFKIVVYTVFYMDREDSQSRILSLVGIHYEKVLAEP